MVQVDSEPKTRRHPRIPYHMRVEVSGRSFSTAGFTSNISRAGLAFSLPLKDFGERASRLPAGTELVLRLHVPEGDAPLVIKCEVVWAGQPSRDAEGRLAVGMGVKFSPDQSGVERAIEALMASFRHRVAVIDLPATGEVKAALNDLYWVEEIGALSAVDDPMARGEVGLIVIGNVRGDTHLVDTVRTVLHHPRVELQPPVLICTPGDSAALAQLFGYRLDVLFAHWPLSPVELRALAVRCVESHAAALENARLRSELEGMVQRLRRENEFFRGTFATGGRFEGIIGDSAPMQRVFQMIHRVAASDASALILGETGTGKDLAARAIHKSGRRSDKPFLAQNCAAIAETLLDSELFGHCRGSFTGAVQDHPGLFEAANGGTLFLDEVAEMSPTMQAKLLHVLQNGELRRLGETRTRKVDVRILCATHRDLEAMVDAGKFRQDLYYRLAVITIRMPPLRDRREDIMPLAVHFLAQFAAENGTEPPLVSAEAMRVLEAYSWRGNVRELQHAMAKLAMLTPPGGRITAPGVQEIVGTEALSLGACQDQQVIVPLQDALEDLERRLVERALRQSRGVIADAARLLRVNRTTLSKRCRRLGIRLMG